MKNIKGKCTPSIVISKEETKKTNKVETNKESKEETNIDETNKEETNQEECNEESKKTKENYAGMDISMGSKFRYFISCRKLTLG